MAQHLDMHSGTPADELSGTNAFVEVFCCGGAVHLSLKQALAQHLGLRLRLSEVRRCALRVLSKTNAEDRIDVCGELIIRNPEESVASLAQEIDSALKITARRPLTPRLVQSALGITNQERLRWTKSGHLRAHGSESFRRGQRITVSTYAVKQIEQLLADPAIIAGWREQDQRNRPIIGPKK